MWTNAALFNFVSIKYLNKNVSHVPKNNIKQHNSFNIENINQHIIIISDGSCDTEDWSNDAENSALHQINKLYLKYIKIGNQY